MVSEEREGFDLFQFTLLVVIPSLFVSELLKGEEIMTANDPGEVLAVLLVGLVLVVAINIFVVVIVAVIVRALSFLEKRNL